MSAAETTTPRKDCWRQLLLAALLLGWSDAALAAGGVLDGKLADNALAEVAQQPKRQAQTRLLDARLADRALADVPWSPPARQTPKRSSEFAALQESLRDAPLAGRRAAEQNSSQRTETRKSDLTSVLANLKNAVPAAASPRAPTPVSKQAASPTPEETVAVAPRQVTVSTSQAAQSAAAPRALSVAAAPAPQRVTTGVLTGLKLLPPEQRVQRPAPAIAAAVIATSRPVETPAAPPPQASQVEAIPAPLPAPTPSPSIVIEVLPPPVATTTPAVPSVPTEASATTTSEQVTPSSTFSVTNILTRMLPAAQPVAAQPKSSPPQAFRSLDPPDKLPLFITARNGETVKIAPTQAATLKGRAIADEALAAYSAVTPPSQAEAPLQFNGLDLNLAVSPPDEATASEAPKPPAQPAAVAPAATSGTDKPVPAQQPDAAMLKKKASETEPAAVALNEDGTAVDLRQELWKEWSEKVILLEQENKALRGELAHTKADPLQDIRVDAVAKIKEQVLRERIIELEKEVLEAQNKAREAALNDAAKKAADAALAPPPSLKDLPLKP